MDLAGIDALLRAGRLEDALAALASTPPDGPDAVARARRHSAVLQALRRPAEAMPVLARAVARDPVDLDLRLDLARLQALLGEVEAAIDGCHAVLARDPAHGGAQRLLGRCLLGRGDAAAARPWLAQAVRALPSDADLAVSLAEAEFLCERSDLAGPRFDARVAADPAPAPMLLLRQVQCLRAEGEAAAARAAAHAALHRHPGFAPLWLELGWCADDAGDADAARDAYSRARSLAPRWADPVACLLNLPPHEATDDARDAAGVLLAEPSTDALSRAALHHALGRDADRRDEGAVARAHWRSANAARRAADGAFDRAAWSRTVDALLETHAQPVAPADDDVALPDAVFVVGLPRSGSSLVESVLSMHPGVHAAGELATWTRAGADLDPDPLAAIRAQAALDAAARARLARAWSARALRAAPHGTRTVVDKHPDNLLQLGLVARCLRRARVVWCRRDLRDNALSIYAEGFARSRGWATDLDDIAFVARAQERLMAHWRRVLPLPVVEARYEDLVAAPEAGFRALHEALGLAFRPEALGFHVQPRVVSTHSRWQVRAPIHARSVGRWRRHAELFDGTTLR